MICSDENSEDASHWLNSTSNFRELYLQECTKNSSLKNDLEIAQAQARTFARELSQIFQHTKVKRKELADANRQLVRYASDLRTTIADLRATHVDLQEAYYDTIFRLVLASEYKDKDTGNHISRMSKYSTQLAQHLGLSSQEIETISYAAPMHDVGKIGIPDNIILKNGMLSENEFSIVKSHTTIGSDILENAQASVLQTAQTIALSHHEHWNGCGYPHGLSREKIPLAARIVALTDTFDALTSLRPYKAPYPIDISCDIIMQERGNQFDPEIVDIFLNHIDDFVAIKSSIDNRAPDQSATMIAWSERDRVFKLR